MQLARHVAPSGTSTSIEPLPARSRSIANSFTSSVIVAAIGADPSPALTPPQSPGPRPESSSTSIRSPAARPGRLLGDQAEPVGAEQSSSRASPARRRRRQPARRTGLEPDPDRLGPVGLLLVRARQLAPDRAAAGSTPCIASSAGRAKSRKVTHRRDRVAGQPEDERLPGGPEAGRLAGLERDAPEDLLDAERRERGLTWSCSPTETPPQSDDHVARRAPALTPRCVASGRRRPRANVDHGAGVAASGGTRRRSS